jgi:hypothetical protein
VANIVLQGCHVALSTLTRLRGARTARYALLKEKYLPSSEPLLLVRENEKEPVRKWVARDPHWTPVHVAVRGHLLVVFGSLNVVLATIKMLVSNDIGLPKQRRRDMLLGWRNPSLHRTETLKFSWKHNVKPHVQCTPGAGSVVRCDAAVSRC